MGHTVGSILRWIFFFPFSIILLHFIQFVRFLSIVQSSHVCFICNSQRFFVVLSGRRQEMYIYPLLGSRSSP